LVAQAVNPAYPVNESALDIMNAVLLSPDEAFIERPISGIERVCMKADLHANRLIDVETRPKSVKVFLTKIKISVGCITQL
jgi:hypothetical protein